MRSSKHTCLLYLGLLLLLGRLFCIAGSGPVYSPPPDLPDFPDIPDLPLPPDPWDLDFPGPDGWDIDFPDPIDDPWVDDIPLPPDPLDLPDPFPDIPSLLTGETLGYGNSALDSFTSSSALNLAHPRAVASNTPTLLMPFPGRYLFPPQPVTRPSGPGPRRSCDPNLSTVVFIPETNRDRLAIVGTCPASILTRVPVGRLPVGATVTPDRTHVWVANAGDGTVSVVDIATRAVMKSITLKSPDGSDVAANAIAFLPDGTRAYVTNHACNPGSTVFVIDTSTYNVLSTIAVGCFPASVAVSPDGSQVWVSERGDSRVDVFDTLTNAPVSAYSIPVATGIAFNPTGTRAYLASGGSPGYIAVVDTSTYAIATTIPVGNLPHALAVTPTGRYLFVTNALSDSMSQINTITNKVVRTIKTPSGKHHPLGLTFVAKTQF